MARGINKVILVGNLGNDPDVKYTQGGMAIATLSVATTSSRKDRDGNFQEKTEWHRVKLFGKLGEIATKRFQLLPEGVPGGGSLRHAEQLHSGGQELGQGPRAHLARWLIAAGYAVEETP